MVMLLSIIYHMTEQWPQDRNGKEKLRKESKINSNTGVLTGGRLSGEGQHRSRVTVRSAAMLERTGRKPTAPPFD